MLTYSLLAIALDAALTFELLRTFPAMIATTLPLGAAAGMIALLWAHARAQRASRRAEIARSFAGLTAVHNGHAIKLSDAPLRGDFSTRRRAVSAALDLGGWAVIVYAYDRYYLLVGRIVTGSRHAVAFRTRAVMDVVPAITAQDALRSA